jgi:replicative DNA helicase
MKLSSPIHRLKRTARDRARSQAIPLHTALDHAAAGEGFASWSHLAATQAQQTKPERLLRRLQPGELVLIAARPLQGKTVLALAMAIAAVRDGRQAHVFSLDYSTKTLAECLIGLGATADMPNLAIDCSDEIAAPYIIDALETAAPETLVVIDYLQLLDQKRQTPPLQRQVEFLAAFARDRRLTMLFVCQIDRAFDSAGNEPPGLSDIRLPNALDLHLFARAIFLHAGNAEMVTI